MRYARILTNDVVNGKGICVSLFMQGCSRHCPDCFNPETWDFKGGQEIEKNDLIKKILTSINANNVKRGFSILGGEPLNPENRKDTADIIKAVKDTYPDINIWVWTGYTIEELKAENDSAINFILQTIDTLIDGAFIAEERDLSLQYRGSRNQRVISLKK